jgi:hypothetical protein
MLTNLNLTDMENGYKLFRAEVLRSIELRENRFGFEPEVTAKISRIPGIRIYEVGIAYYGRTYEEGKKINWKDGIRALYAIIKYNLFSGERTYQPAEALFPRRLAYIIMSVFFVAGLILIFAAKGTGDEGDSVMHYLFARNAYQNPAHFFNHWAKPLFVFLAAPFAQMGMKGMKFFNLLCSLAAMYFSFRSAGQLHYKNTWLVPLCMAFAPWMMIVTLSGLTEPLFALWLVLGIYLILKGKNIAGIVWLSFLPFVRSEGLIILCVLLLYLLVKKYFRYIPLLLTGHLFYSVAGYFVHRDLLWVFNKMTYATLSSAYGKGPWTHFLHAMPEVLGKVVCTFLVIGLLYGAIRCIGKYFFSQRNWITDEETFLVYGMFIVYFIGHSAFWALGIFNSFGLIRVMIGILPLIGLIAARGFNLVAGISSIALYRFVLYICCLLIITYPFMGRIYSFNWQRDFCLKADQVAEDRLGAYVRQHIPDYRKRPVFFEACYVSVALDLNFFDTAQSRTLQHAFDTDRFPEGSLLVWDDWFAQEQGLVTEEQLMADPRFELVQAFEQKDVWNRVRRVKLFRVKMNRVTPD